MPTFDGVADFLGACIRSTLKWGLPYLLWSRQGFVMPISVVRLFLSRAIFRANFPHKLHKLLYLHIYFVALSLNSSKSIVGFLHKLSVKGPSCSIVTI